MDQNIFILKKSVGWSMLKDGFNINVEQRGLFNYYMQEILNHGANHEICIRIDGEDFKASLKNINFRQSNWDTHKDLIQIRYSAQSAIAQKLRSVFSVSYQYLLAEKQRQENKRKQIVLPDAINEYIVLSATTEPYVFQLDCFTANDALHLKKTMEYIGEEEFENSEDDQVLAERVGKMTDPHASIEERERIVKIRKVDRSIIENLKYIYHNRCQITGEKVGEEFGRCVIEAHHIQYFTRSQNNDAKNIIILSPNYHRIIHRNNPHFDVESKCFVFDNGVRLGLKLNEHL